MADYIKREDVLEFSKIFDDQLWETGGYRNYPTEAVPVEAIKNIPSADVAEVRHGKWLWDGYVYDEPYVCNCCGNRMDYESNFCPHCGARMEEWMVEHECFS